MNSQDKATRRRPSFLAAASDFDNKKWIKTGLLWGLFMFLVGSIGFPYFNGQEITWKSVLVGIVIWTIGGLGFGYTMKFIWKKTNNKNGKNTAVGEAVSIIRTNGYNEALNINNDQMTTKSGIFEIRADYNDKEIAVFAAFGSIIAEKAIASQKLLPPFAYDRMTWIKPSFLWLMYRSEWGNKAGMERILKIWIRRQDWDAALTEAILTTPEKHVYDNPKNGGTSYKRREYVFNGILRETCRIIG
jgi:hypothetical protein